MYMLDMKPVFVYLDLPTMQGGLRRCDVFWEGRKVQHEDIFIDFYHHTCPCELFIFLYSSLALYYKGLLKLTVRLFIPRLNEGWQEIGFR